MEMKCEATRKSISGEGLGSGQAWGLQGNTRREAGLLGIWNWERGVTLRRPGPGTFPGPLIGGYDGP